MYKRITAVCFWFVLGFTAYCAKRTIPRLTDRETRRVKVISVTKYEDQSDVRGPIYLYQASTSADDSVFTNLALREAHKLGDIFCFAYDQDGNDAHEVLCPWFLPPWKTAFRHQRTNKGTWTGY